MRISDKELESRQQEINKLIGYNKYQVGQRYNYYAIDIYSKEGKMKYVYETGFSKLQVYDVLGHIREGLYNNLKKED